MAPSDKQLKSTPHEQLEHRLLNRNNCFRHIKSELEPITKQLKTCTTRAAEAVGSLLGVGPLLDTAHALHQNLGSYQENVHGLPPTLRYGDLAECLEGIRGSALLDLIEQLETGRDAPGERLGFAMSGLDTGLPTFDRFTSSCSNQKRALLSSERDTDRLIICSGKDVDPGPLLTQLVETVTLRMQDALRCFTMRTNDLQLQVISATACDPQWLTKSNCEREQLVKKKMRWATDPRNPDMLHEAGNQDQWELIRQLELYDIHVDALKKVQDGSERLKRAIASLVELDDMEGQAV